MVSYNHSSLSSTFSDDARSSSSSSSSSSDVESARWVPSKKVCVIATIVSVLAAAGLISLCIWKAVVTCQATEHHYPIFFLEASNQRTPQVFGVRPVFTEREMRGDDYEKIYPASVGAPAPVVNEDVSPFPGAVKAESDVRLEMRCSKDVYRHGLKPWDRPQSDGRAERCGFASSSRVTLKHEHGVLTLTVFGRKYEPIAWRRGCASSIETGSYDDTYGNQDGTIWFVFKELDRRQCLKFFEDFKSGLSEKAKRTADPASFFNRNQFHAKMGTRFFSITWKRTSQPKVDEVPFMEWTGLDKMDDGSSEEAKIVELDSKEEPPQKYCKTWNGFWNNYWAKWDAA